MAKVETKTKMSMEIDVIGRDGTTRERLSLTSGNIYYYRTNAKKATAQYTYQQLIEMIENSLSEE